MNSCNNDIVKAMNDLNGDRLPATKNINDVNLNVGKILDELKSMKVRGSILHGHNVTEEDIYIQMTGLIVKLALEEV